MPFHARISPGLSPHARGNRPRPRSSADLLGSIPARAGQPDSLSSTRTASAVYPRTRGATNEMPFHARISPGLSPHARGNRPRPRSSADLLGSIPARAGQPGFTVQYEDGICGLSPHARGNHDSLLRERQALRSIPARAGQPASAGSARRTTTVYPRTRGATLNTRKRNLQVFGLSPHSAGQPVAPVYVTARVRVYPRTRGATSYLDGFPQ